MKHTKCVALDSFLNKHSHICCISTSYLFVSIESECFLCNEHTQISIESLTDFRSAAVTKTLCSFIGRSFLSWCLLGWWYSRATSLVNWAALKHRKQLSTSHRHNWRRSRWNGFCLFSRSLWYTLTQYSVEFLHFWKEKRSKNITIVANKRPRPIGRGSSSLSLFVYPLSSDDFCALVVDIKWANLLIGLRSLGSWLLILWI